MSRSAPIRHQGNDSLFLAVEMSVLSTLIGIPLHVHAEGLRGTGKTTVMRWARRIMPSIERVRGCHYQCDPHHPHCPVHSLNGVLDPGSNGRADSRQNLQTETSPMPFVEIGHGAKLGTILGSIDLGRLTNRENPAAALLPGAIPMAHRGILFVDEVNRLAETAPEITDVLLSVMGTKPGRVKIEEVGLPPWELEVRASVWAASNPDEDPGPLEDIRKQLADRFDLVVPVQRPGDAAIVERLLAAKSNTLLGTVYAMDDLDTQHAEKTQDYAARFLETIHQKARLFSSIVVPAALLKYMAQLYVQRNVESLRAIEALELTSRLLACIREKDEVTFDEVLTVIPLVLRHRVEPGTLSEILKDLEIRKAAGPQVQTPVQDDCVTPPSSDDGQEDRLEQSSAKEAPWRELHEAQDNVKVTWFRRLLSRQSGKTAESVRPTDQATGHRTQTDGRLTRSQAGPTQKLPDPASLPPSSPPDPARRISLLSWEELVMPPDVKNRTYP
ncbi:MAG: magnesium chelatase [Bacillota bacterium]|jgi:magnesium chelatase subunit I